MSSIEENERPTPPARPRVWPAVMALMLAAVAAWAIGEIFFQ